MREGGAWQAQRTAKGRGVEFKGGRCVVGDSLGPEPALRWPDEGGWDLIVTDGMLGSCPDPRAPGGVRYREWESSGVLEQSSSRHWPAPATRPVFAKLEAYLLASGV